MALRRCLAVGLGRAACRRTAASAAAAEPAPGPRVVAEGRRASHPRKQFLAVQVEEVAVRPALSMVLHYNSLGSAEWAAVRGKLARAGVGLRVLPSKPTARIL